MSRRATNTNIALQQKPSRVMFDRGMYLVALVTPVLTIPQLLLIWIGHEAAGVSIVTWGTYAAVSGIWLIYGILQRQKPLILSQACLFLVDFAVVLGVAIFR